MVGLVVVKDETESQEDEELVAASDSYSSPSAAAVAGSAGDLAQQLACAFVASGEAPLQLTPAQMDELANGALRGECAFGLVRPRWGGRPEPFATASPQEVAQATAAGEAAATAALREQAVSVAMAAAAAQAVLASGGTVQ